MTTSNFISPTLGGAGAALGLYGSAKSGDPEQIAGSAYQGLGAYTAASEALAQRAFQEALKKATEMGLSGTAATQYANQAAQDAQLAGSSSIGSWLPYIGLGLSAYDFLKDPSHEGAWNVANFAGMAFAGPMAPMYAALEALTLGVQYYSSQKNKHKKHYIYWHTPVLDVVGQDDEGWVYLYDTNSSLTDEGDKFGTDEEINALKSGQQSDYSRLEDVDSGERLAAYYSSFGRNITSNPMQQGRQNFMPKEEFDEAFDIERGFLLRYNPATNKLQRIEGRINSEEDFEKYLSSGEWKDVDLSQNWNERTDADPVLFDPSALQSEIFNKVLIPQGYVDKPSVESGWQPVTIGDKEYLMNQDGYLADAGSGYLLGAVNPEDGQVLDFYGTKGKDRIRKDDRGKFSKDSEIQQGGRAYLGYIDNWNQAKQFLSNRSDDVSSLYGNGDEGDVSATPQSMGLPGFTNPFNPNQQTISGTEGQTETPSLGGLPGFQPKPAEQPQSTEGGLPGFLPSTQQQPQQQNVQPDFNNPFNNVQNNIPFPNPQGLPTFISSFPKDGLAAGI